MQPLYHILISNSLLCVMHWKYLIREYVILRTTCCTNDKKPHWMSYFANERHRDLWSLAIVETGAFVGSIGKVQVVIDLLVLKK